MALCFEDYQSRHAKPQHILLLSNASVKVVNVTNNKYPSVPFLVKKKKANST